MTATEVAQQAEVAVAVSKIEALGTLLIAAGTSDHHIDGDTLVATGLMVREHAAEIERLLARRA